MGLKTDYKDSMYDGQRRYRLIPNEDGTYSIPDATVYTQQGDKFGAKDINQTNEEINKLEAVKLVTLPVAGWSSSSPYTQTVSVTGMTADDRPIVSLYLPSGITAADVKLQSKAYGYVDRAVTGDGNITVICYNKKPAADFQIQMKGGVMMAECIVLKGGGSGAGSDDCTSTRNELLKGYTAVTGDSGDEPAEGALELTGNALTNQVLAGATFYSTDAKNKLTGTVAVQSILSFSAAVYSSTAITFTWKNPAKGPFSGVIVVGKTGSYPTSITDGTRYHKGSGNNTNANGTSSITISSFSSGITYYFRVFSYAIKDGTEWIHATTYTATTATTKGQQVITSSGTFTVPAGVRSIDDFCVGGGSGGNGGGRNSSSYSAGGGGGGGYTRTQKNISVTPGLSVSIIIGAGGAGAAADSYGSGKPGGATTITINGTAYTANGGLGNSVTSGNHGGSGGGGAGGLGDGGGGVGGSNGSGGASGGSGVCIIRWGY